MNFDFKVTVWERITVEEEDEQKVLDAIKNGTVTCSNDIYNLLSDSDNISCDFLDDTIEQISLEENDHQSTIEVVGDDGGSIFTN
jgi:hypothetical protein